MNLWNETKHFHFNVTQDEEFGNFTNSALHIKPLMMPFNALVTFFSLIFLASLLGNTAVILVVLKIKRMKTRMNYLLANLSISGLAVTTLCMPFSSVEYLLTSKWIFESGVCRGFHVLETTLILGCIFTVLAISYDRYLGICNAMNTYTRWRATSIQRIIIAIWVSSLVIAFPMAFSVDKVHIATHQEMTIHTCSLQTDNFPKRIYHGTVSAVFMIVFVVMTYLVCRMTIALCSRKKRRPKVIAKLISVAVTYLALILPSRVVSILSIASPYNSNRLIDFQTSLVLYEICRFATFMNFALNPFLYNFSSKKFNTAFKELIKNTEIEDEEDGLERLRTGSSSIQGSVQRFKMRLELNQSLKSVNKL